MGNKVSVSPAKAYISYEDLPIFTIDRQIHNRIILGCDNDKFGIKYCDIYSTIWYFEIYQSYKTQKNYIEFLFEGGASLIIYYKSDLCSENGTREDNNLYFMFESKNNMKFNGKINPEYTEINFKNCPFDKILSEL